MTNHCWDALISNYTYISDNCYIHKTKHSIVYRNNNGELHRLDGPAVIFNNRNEINHYFINGMPYHDNFTQYITDSGISKEESVFMILKYGNNK